MTPAIPGGGGGGGIVVGNGKPDPGRKFSKPVGMNCSKPGANPPTRKGRGGCRPVNEETNPDSWGY